MTNKSNPDLILLGGISRYKILNWLFPNRCLSKDDYLGKAVWIYYGKEKLIDNNKSLVCYSEKILPDSKILISGDIIKDEFFFPDDDVVFIFDGDPKGNKKANDDAFDGSLFGLCLDFPYNTDVYKNVFESLFNDALTTNIIFVEDKRRFGDTDDDSNISYENDIKNEFKSKYKLDENDFVVIKDNEFSLLINKMNNFFTSSRLILRMKYNLLLKKLSKKHKAINNKIEELLLPSSLDFTKVCSYDEFFPNKSLDLEICFKEGIQNYILPGLISEIKETINGFFYKFNNVVFWNFDEDLKDNIDNRIHKEFINWKSGLPKLDKPESKRKYILALADENSELYGANRIFIDCFKKSFIKNCISTIIHEFIDNHILLINKFLNII